jgi:hypothetical protein
MPPLALPQHSYLFCPDCSRSPTRPRSTPCTPPRTSSALPPSTRSAWRRSARRSTRPERREMDCCWPLWARQRSGGLRMRRRRRCAPPSIACSARSASGAPRPESARLLRRPGRVCSPPPSPPALSQSVPLRAAYARRAERRPFGTEPVAEWHHKVAAKVLSETTRSIPRRSGRSRRR